MDTFPIYLEPRSTFSTWPHSDTLFGALCWAIFHVHGEKTLTTMLTGSKEKPRFVLSSAFPFVGTSDDRVLFFPKPFVRELRSRELEDLAKERTESAKATTKPELKQAMVTVNDASKATRKIAFVSESIFREMVIDSLDMLGIYRRLHGALESPERISRLGNALITKKETERVYPLRGSMRLFDTVDVLRNQIDRLKGITAQGFLFYDPQYSFSQGASGLWFLLRTDDPAFFRPLFRYLEDTGIGGNRTTGKGHFKITFDGQRFALPKAEAPDSLVILSRWFPTPEERRFEGPASWQLLSLRPKRDTMYSFGSARVFKDAIRMFVEGSVFPLHKRADYYGMLVPAGSFGRHNTYHNGLAMPVFAKIGVYNENSCLDAFTHWKRRDP